MIGGGISALYEAIAIIRESQSESAEGATWPPNVFLRRGRRPTRLTTHSRACLAFG
jgi:hypothetical protein